MNRWKSVYDALDAAGIDVFPPGAHEGICAAPYCVVRCAGGALMDSGGGYARYIVHLYAPLDRPDDVETLAERVRTALAPLERSGLLTLAQPRGATLIDDQFAACASYIEYASYYREHQGDSPV